MTKTKSFWQKQVSGPERAFLLEVLASKFGRSLYIPLGFATIIFSTGFLFPDEVFSGISVHYLDALTFPASLGVFLLARLISDKRFDGRLNVLLWIAAGTLSALAPTTFLLLVTGQAPVKFSSQIPIGIVAKVGLQDDGTFHDIKVMLLTHFSTLRYVYVIENKFAGQQATLEQAKPKAD